MKKFFYIIMMGLVMTYLAACTSDDQLLSSETSSSGGTDNVRGKDKELKMNHLEEETDMKENVFYITIGGKTFTAAFSDNSGADALKEWLEEEELTVEMNDYGGFEKVGSLGRNLPASNSRTTTQSGDIVLYQGNQMVMFYGSNSWSYTRLGKVEDLSGWEETLGTGDVTVKLSLDNPQE